MVSRTRTILRRLEHESRQAQHIGDLDMGIPPGSLLLRNDRVEVNCRPDWKIASMFNPALSLVDVHAPGGE